VLNSKNWTSHSFDVDLRKAAAPDLSDEAVREVTNVKVILANNKDEDHAGQELFRRLTGALGTRAGDKATLTFERWNLTTITEKVRDTLLTPSLLPQSFFSHFGYLCSQFGDFRHVSDEWTSQLVPNWWRYLEELLKDDADERSVRLLPVALIVLREHGGSNLTRDTGWIDLMEWAVLAAWRVHQSTKNPKVQRAIVEMYVGLYVAELERYYQSQSTNLAVQFSLEKHEAGGFVDAVASSVVSLWHVARLGILTLAFSELLHDESEAGTTKREVAQQTVANSVVPRSADPPGGRCR
jgi:hypothetical protein